MTGYDYASITIVWCSLLFAIWTFVLCHPGRQTSRSRKTACYTLVIFLCADAAFYVIHLYLQKTAVPAQFRSLLPLVGFALTAARTGTAMLFSLYVFEVANIFEGREKILYALFFMPWDIEIVILAFSLKTGLAFSYDANHHFVRGSQMDVIFTVSLVYIVFAFYIFILHRRRLPEKIVRDTLAGLALASAGIILYRIDSRLYLEFFLECIAFSCLMVTVENSVILTSPGTGNYNSTAFFYANRQMLYDFPSYRIYRIAFDTAQYHQAVGELTYGELKRQVSERLSSKFTWQNVYIFENGCFAVVDTDQKKPDLTADIASCFEDQFVTRGIPIQLSPDISVLNVPEEAESASDCQKFMTTDPDTVLS